MSKGRSNSNWAMGPQLVCPPTCHLLLGQNMGQSQPQAEGKGAWLMACRGQCPRAQNRAERAENGTGKAVHPNAEERAHMIECALNLVSFWPCTVLTHAPCQPEVSTAPPGDGVYIRDSPPGSGAEHLASDSGYLYTGYRTLLE